MHAKALSCQIRGLAIRSAPWETCHSGHEWHVSLPRWRRPSVSDLRSTDVSLKYSWLRRVGDSHEHSCRHSEIPAKVEVPKWPWPVAMAAGWNSAAEPFRLTLWSCDRHAIQCIASDCRMYCTSYNNACVIAITEFRHVPELGRNKRGLWCFGRRYGHIQNSRLALLLFLCLLVHSI